MQYDSPQNNNLSATKKANPKDNPKLDSISKNITEVGSRLRVIEDRYGNLRNKTQMSDKNFLDFEKNIHDELKLINQEMFDLKKQLAELLQKISQMYVELEKVVKVTDFKVLEKYLDLWQPMNFVTKDEFERFIKQDKFDTNK
ncbi:MAG: hypothetical protein ABIC91_06395 [Nanoarchaeota archaeon]|nr:hypothetical protein [Nanoarchaeota archaeon]MBU1030404.1 hypothetical protein [Nanoarchaeota archaeon]MBU1850026.1 hypothetical protein [Nanoarchaeota archaeon]